VLGLSLGATVIRQSLRNQLSDRLESGNEADEIVRKVRQSLDYIDDLDPKIAEIVRQCYGTATNASFILMTGIVACAFLSALFIREKKLSKQLRTI